MRKLTKQQMFNKAVLGVVKQGRRSIGIGGCAYRAKTPDGATLACGVGQLIDDDLYDARVENLGANAVDPESWFETSHRTEDKEWLCLSLCFSGVDASRSDVARFLDEIQQAHDQALDIDDFVERCRLLAKAERLTMPRLPAKYA